MRQTFIDFIGILFVLVFCSFTLIALVLHGYYNPFKETVSELGAGNGSTYFNIGFIISGYIGSFAAYERYKKFNKPLMVIGIFTMNSLALVGWFPLNTDLHGFFTAMLFGSIFVFFLLYIVLIRSRFVAGMLLISIIFIFISLPMTEWIIFIAVNIWMSLTSMKFYYRKRKMYNKFVNI